MDQDGTQQVDREQLRVPMQHRQTISVQSLTYMYQTRRHAHAYRMQACRPSVCFVVNARITAQICVDAHEQAYMAVCMVA